MLQMTYFSGDKLKVTWHPALQGAEVSARRALVPAVAKPGRFVGDLC